MVKLIKIVIFFVLVHQSQRVLILLIHGIPENLGNKNGRRELSLLTRRKNLHQSYK